MKIKVCALVVTYNRKKLLEECIDAIFQQTYPIEYLVIIDNNSTDGTEELIKKYNNNKLVYYKLDSNLGGAGGFNYGFQKAYSLDFDYLWIMDDDTIPEKNCLENLIDTYKFHFINKKDFLCSFIKWNDETACKMNVPSLHNNWSVNLNYGLIKVNSCSFVSLLINKEIIEELGLPIKEFFIWADDVEYTSRISEKYNGYMVINSKVIHKMNKNISTNIIFDTDDRIDRYFYYYRNKMYLYKNYYNNKQKIKFIYSILNSIGKVIFTQNRNKYKKIKIILKGLLRGIIFNPKIEYVTMDKE